MALRSTEVEVRHILDRGGSTPGTTGWFRYIAR